jgi:transcription-repair coupling factor (superfamily II helicase)
MALDFVDLSPASADPSRAAFLPFDYIEEERPRIAAYRRLAELADAGEVARLREEWRDRYGPLPPPAERLLRIAEIRVAAAARGLAAVETREGKILLTREGELLTRGGRLPRLRKLATDARLCELRTVVQEA